MKENIISWNVNIIGCVMESLYDMSEITYIKVLVHSLIYKQYIWLFPSYMYTILYIYSTHTYILYHMVIPPIYEDYII